MAVYNNNISVVICAYTEKRWDALVAAVHSLQLQTVSPSEIIVVIDHNPNLTNRVKTDIVGVTVLENKEKNGLSGARNTAIAAVKGDIIAFMDEDATAEPRWLEHLLAHYTNEKVLGSGGSIIPTWLSAKPVWFPDEFLWVVGCTYLGMPTATQSVRNLIGCNMSFRSMLFQTVGGFRNDIGRVGTRPVGCEETELCIRARQNLPGQRLIYDPAAAVHHRVPADRCTWTYFLSRCFSEGLSKALISRYVGSGDGLASERAYTTKTLPSGVLRGIRETFTGRDRGGLGRSVAIILGFTYTGVGFVVGSITLRISGARKQNSVPARGSIVTESADIR